MSEKPHIVIVEGRFRDELSNILLKGACEFLEEQDITPEIIAGSGMVEVPFLINKRLKKTFNTEAQKVDGFIALGCIKVENLKNAFVGFNAYHFSMKMQLETGVPIAMGLPILLPWQKPEPKKLHLEGYQAGKAVLRTLELTK